MTVGSTWPGEPACVLSVARTPATTLVVVLCMERRNRNLAAVESDNPMTLAYSKEFLTMRFFLATLAALCLAPFASADWVKGPDGNLAWVSAGSAKPSHTICPCFETGTCTCTEATCACKGCGRGGASQETKKPQGASSASRVAASGRRQPSSLAGSTQTTPAPTAPTPVRQAPAPGSSGPLPATATPTNAPDVIRLGGTSGGCANGQCATQRRGLLGRR